MHDDVAIHPPRQIAYAPYVSDYSRYRQYSAAAAVTGLLPPWRVAALRSGGGMFPAIGWAVPPGRRGGAVVRCGRLGGGGAAAGKSGQAVPFLPVFLLILESPITGGI